MEILLGIIYEVLKKIKKEFHEVHLVQLTFEKCGQGIYPESDRMCVTCLIQTINRERFHCKTSERANRRYNTQGMYPIWLPQQGITWEFIVMLQDRKFIPRVCHKLIECGKYSQR